MHHCCTTAAESPWTNGLVERHNAVLGLTVRKIMDDLDCDIDIAVGWTISAKNSLKSVHGFSSNQLVFGCNPNFPNMLDNKPPALEKLSCSDTVRMNLNAMHLAREEFIKNESSAKLAKALKSQTRTHNDVAYKTGDLVFYKRGKNAWKGPGTVIGQEGQQILIKHSSSYIRVHPCNVKLRTNDTIPLSALECPNESKPNSMNNIDSSNKNIISCERNQDINYDHNSDSINIPVVNIIDQDSSEISNGNIDLTEHQNINNTSSIQSEDKSESIEPSLDCEENQFLANNVKPKINNYVECVTRNNGDKKQLQIISRAGKATGKYPNWYNTRNIDSGEIKAINWMTLNNGGL